VYEWIAITAIITAGTIIGIKQLATPNAKHLTQLRKGYEELLEIKSSQIKQLRGKIASMYNVPVDAKAEGLPIEDTLHAVVKALPPQYRTIIEPFMKPAIDYLRANPEIKQNIENVIKERQSLMKSDDKKAEQHVEAV